jgi:hypothetical protein
VNLIAASTGLKSCGGVSPHAGRQSASAKSKLAEFKLAMKRVLMKRRAAAANHKRRQIIIAKLNIDGARQENNDNVLALSLYVCVNHPFWSTCHGGRQIGVCGRVCFAAQADERAAAARSGGEKKSKKVYHSRHVAV